MASSISEAARRRSIVAVVLLAVTAGGLFAAGPARAQAAAAASDPTRDAARAKLVDGVAALKRGDHRAALARFEEAYALVPSPKIHYDFGLAYVGLGRPADALAAFERFLAEALDAPADKRAKAASLVSTLRAEVAEKTARDGGPAVVAMPESSGAPPPTAPGSGGAPPPQPRAVVAAPQTEVAAAPATPDGTALRSRRITGLALMGGGAGVLAAGLVFGVLAQREGDSLTSDSQMGADDTPTPFDPSKESRGIAYERLQKIGLITGALAVVAGAVLYTSGHARVAVEPVAGPSVAGASVRVRF
jgi:tetratricopeptide (TPR) repeat protein